MGHLWSPYSRSNRGPPSVERDCRVAVSLLATMRCEWCPLFHLNYRRLVRLLVAARGAWWTDDELWYGAARRGVIVDVVDRWDLWTFCLHLRLSCSEDSSAEARRSTSQLTMAAFTVGGRPHSDWSSCRHATARPPLHWECPREKF